MNWNTNSKPGLIAEQQCLTYTVVAKWDQIPAAMYQSVVKRLKPEEWRLLWQLNNANGFGRRCFTVKILCNVCVYTFGHVM